MTDPGPDLAVLLPRIEEDEIRGTEAPTTEEILAYLAGELSPADAEEFQERLSLHPEATRLLLDLADPSRLDDAEVAQASLPDPELLRQQLRDEGLFDPPATTVPSPVVPIQPGVHVFYRWATAALLVLCLGLGYQLTRRPVGVPASDVALWELMARDESARRDQGEAVEAQSDFSHDLVLYATEIGVDAVHRVVVVDAEGHERLAREVRTNVAGRVVLRLAADAFAPGTYEVRLFVGEASEPTVYDLDWRRP